MRRCRLRPATSAEALAMQFEPNVRYEPGHPEDQQAFVDARAPLDHDGDEPAADPPEDRPAENPDDPETPRSVMKPEFEHTRHHEPDPAAARIRWMTVRLLC